MSRRVWTGIVAGTLAAMVALSIAFGAYRAGQNSEVVTRTVPDGEVVRVIGHGWYGPGPGFFLFPLLAIVLVVLFLRGRHHWNGGWNRPYGPGPWGPGPYAERAFDEWHRRAHEGGDLRAETEREPSGKDRTV